MNLLSTLKLRAALKQKRQFQNQLITSGFSFPFSSPLFALVTTNHAIRKGGCPWKRSVQTILFIITVFSQLQWQDQLFPSWNLAALPIVQTSSKILVVFPLSVDLNSHQIYRWPCLPILRFSQAILLSTASNGDFMNHICHRDEHRFPVF